MAGTLKEELEKAAPKIEEMQENIKSMGKGSDLLKSITQRLRYDYPRQKE